eukprot:TRINITY_DN20894_c0_g1_i1.p1 TRINITY_DN20894_c0_g1~~TRINITY_DN20894_c0_g1_i1.p1  ORF type:complete len:294 (+),score=47.27 TRINITY_DN20894_c0_g1_i1:150-1031(+)
MNNYTRNRAGLVHPNAVVARHELNRQERNRLGRLGNVTSSGCSLGKRDPKLRYGDGSSRTGSRPQSASGRRDFPEEDPYFATLAAAAGDRGASCMRPRSSSAGSRRGLPSHGTPVSTMCGSSRPSSPASTAPLGCGNSSAAWHAACGQPLLPQALMESGVSPMPSFLLCPRQRLEDVHLSLQIAGPEEERLLREEMESWYFGADTGGGFTAAMMQMQQAAEAPPPAAAVAVTPSRQAAWAGQGRPASGNGAAAVASLRQKPAMQLSLGPAKLLQPFSTTRLMAQPSEARDQRV